MFQPSAGMPWVFRSEGKAKRVLQTHCGDLEKQFCFKTALTRLLGQQIGIPFSWGNISVGVSRSLFKKSKKIIGNLLEKALLWLNYCTVPAHLCLSLTESTILRLSCIFPSKGVNISGKRKDPLTTEKLSNAVSQRSCLFIFTGATDVCLVFSAHPSINLKTTHTWTYDMQLSAPR